MDKTLENIFRPFGDVFYNALDKVKEDISEIRVRCEKPVVIYICGKPYFLERTGNISLPKKALDPIIITYREMKNIFSALCEFSF